jgi:transcriptional regulator with XRE-family HTH domain
MQKTLNHEAVKKALQDCGWTQKDLAREIGVTAQAVTNWLRGIDFPRPDKLLKLATSLKLGFKDLVIVDTKDQPVIAFRKKGSAKTTDAHVLKAMAMGSLLSPLVSFLPKFHALRVSIASPVIKYDTLQATAQEVRTFLGINDGAVLSYENLIDQFNANGAVIVPVMWGEKNCHKNALHIFLPKEQATFIYLNLDTRLEDFKFWMAHELAHVYTPHMAGSVAGEDFADALAGALLFPKSIAEVVYQEVIRQRSIQGEIRVLKRHASLHSISLFSVFCEINRYAKSQSLPVLRCKEKDVHAIRQVQRGKLMSEILFKDSPPATSAYLTVTQQVFKSDFFVALKKMISQLGTGPGYLQQIMDISISDALTLHRELCR